MNRGCTIGTFDGVHRGHTLLLATLRDLCRERRLIPTAVTFDRHPLEVVAPARAPRRLLSPQRQQQLLREAGADAVVIFPFTPELSAISAREWIRCMRDDLDTSMILLGYDNHFGHDGRSLTHDDLRRIGNEEGVEIVVGPELPDASSSAVRRALERGDIAEATRLLGRAPEIEGTVVKGQQLGRTLGFPTANLTPAPNALIPLPGVYAARIRLLPSGEKILSAESSSAERESEQHRFPVMLNIGSRPTVAENLPSTIEAHIIGFDGNLYGKELRLELIARIRDERRFPSLEDLKRELEADRDNVLDIFSKNILSDNDS